MNQQFTLPDGTLVGTGNIQPVRLPMLFREFPEHKFLENADIKRLLDGKVKRFRLLRKRFLRWMINQGRLGKCNASAAVGALHRTRRKSGQSHVPLADNHLYYRINGGSDGGSLLHDGMNEIETGGVSPRELFSGDRKIGEIGQDVFNVRQVPPSIRNLADENAPRFRSHEPFRMPTDYSTFRRCVATCLALDYPIVMAWDVTNQSMRLRKGYIVSGRGPGNHASFWHSARWVGGNDLVHPDLCNSWGPTASAMYGPTSPGWGESGYGLMTMEQAFHCRRSHEFYALIGCVQDPNERVLG